MRFGMMIGLAGMATGCLAQTIHTYAPPAGSNGLVASGVSGNGTATCGWYGWAGGPSGAYRWTVAGGLQAIPAVPGNGPNYGQSLSRDGVHVAGSSGTVGYRWSQAGGTTAIGPYPSGSPTEVYGVSPDGVTCFGRVRQPSGAMRAFTWTASGGATLMPQLPGGFNSSVSFTNQNASVAYGSADLAGVDQPVIWNGATITNLYSLHGNLAYFRSVADNELTIWGYGFVTGGHQQLRYRKVGPGWTLDNLGTYPGSTSTIPGGCVADATAVVGECWGGTAPASGAYLFSTDLGYQELSSWLTSVGFNLGGLQLQGGVAISADGTAIHGRGFLGGQQVGWVARGVPCLHRPSITQDPQDLVQACAGSSFSVSAAAGGSYTGNLTYQWYKNGVLINNGPSGSGSQYSGVTTAGLTVSNLSAADNGFYSCTFSNPCGSTSSSSAEVMVYGQTALLSLPAPAWACTGGSASYTITAVNASAYLWEWNNGSGWVGIPNGGTFDFNTGVSWNATGATTGNLQLSGINFGILQQIPIRCTVYGQCRVMRPVETMLYLDGPMDINGATSDYFCHYTPATFSTAVYSGNPTGYNWQLLDPTFNTWIYLSDGYFADGYTGMTANISGALSPTLSFNIQAPGTIPNQLYFRCAVSNSCGWQFSPAGVLTLCRGDFNCDGYADFFDYLDFVNAISGQAGAADFNGDGFIDFFDYLDFIGELSAGC